MSLLRRALKQLLPPIVVRGLKAMTVNGEAGVRWRTPNTVLFENGAKLRLRSGTTDGLVYSQIFEHRHYDINGFPWMEALVARYDALEKPLILDCGANIGASALWFSFTFPRAQIVAIEPDTGNLRMLRLNATNHVRVVEGAVASFSGRVGVADPGNGGWAMRTVPGDDVRAYSVDELVAASGATPLILKIDIEGFESDLFTTPSPLLNEFPLVIIELHDWMMPGSASSRPFLKWHSSHDRDFYHRGENIFSYRNDS